MKKLLYSLPFLSFFSFANESSRVSLKCSNIDSKELVSLELKVDARLLIKRDANYFGLPYKDIVKEVAQPATGLSSYKVDQSYVPFLVEAKLDDLTDESLAKSITVLNPDAYNPKPASPSRLSVKIELDGKDGKKLEITLNELFNVFYDFYDAQGNKSTAKESKLLPSSIGLDEKVIFASLIVIKPESPGSKTTVLASDEKLLCSVITP